MKKQQFSFISYSSTFLIFTYYFLTATLYAVPPDYCLQALNKSDCNGTPTPVYSYYKPRSLCELEIWRGCPTQNKFENEYECSHICVGRLFIDEDPNLETEDSYICNLKFDGDKCTKNKTSVYYYDATALRCVKGDWYGCECKNKFDDEKSCIRACIGLADNWEKTLNELNVDHLQRITNVLNDVIKHPEKIKLKDTHIPLVIVETTEVITTEEAKTETTTVVDENHPVTEVETVR